MHVLSTLIKMFCQTLFFKKIKKGQKKKKKKKRFRGDNTHQSKRKIYRT